MKNLFLLAVMGVTASAAVLFIVDPSIKMEVAPRTPAPPTPELPITPMAPLF